MKLYLASSNEGKVRELRRMMTAAGLPVEVVAASTVGGMPEVDETEPVFAGNARLKARALQALTPSDGWVLADDSGLEVEALEGGPGVRSARYAGENATDVENRGKLLREMKGVGPGNRGGRFVCALILLDPAGGEKLFEGCCPGRLAEEERGGGGFGYDPVFVPYGYDRTFGELPSEIKDRHSHRAEAFRKLVDWLRRTRPWAAGSGQWPAETGEF